MAEEFARGAIDGAMEVNGIVARPDGGSNHVHEDHRHQLASRNLLIQVHALRRNVPSAYPTIFSDRTDSGSIGREANASDPILVERTFEDDRVLLEVEEDDFAISTSPSDEIPFFREI